MWRAGFAPSCNGKSVSMFRIFDIRYRRVVGTDFETREEAKQRLAELIEADPGAEDSLRILAAGSGAPVRLLNTIEV